MGSQLYFGRVMHQRMMPMRYRFVYRVFGLLIDVDHIEKEVKTLNWLSLERFNLLSLYRRDHGARDGSNWRAWLENLVADVGITDIATIKLSCFPRVLGYGFNPLSVWYCYNDNAETIAIISEVSNTFGGVYHYIHHDNGQALNWPVECRAEKRFHVSPFINMAQEYHFKFSRKAQRITVLINEYQDEQLHLIASQDANLASLTNWNLIKAFFMIPLMSFKVMAMIHWHALKIWIRGGQFHPYRDEKSLTENKSEWIVKKHK